MPHACCMHFSAWVSAVPHLIAFKPAISVHRYFGVEPLSACTKQIVSPFLNNMLQAVARCGRTLRSRDIVLAVQTVDHVAVDAPNRKSRSTPFPHP